jgi:hypothetical protein
MSTTCEVSSDRCWNFKVMMIEFLKFECFSFFLTAHCITMMMIFRYDAIGHDKNEQRLADQQAQSDVRQQPPTTIQYIKKHHDGKRLPKQRRTIHKKGDSRRHKEKTHGKRKGWTSSSHSNHHHRRSIVAF